MLCNKLSAPVSERWQVQYTTQMASNCTHTGPIGVVNTVLWVDRLVLPVFG